MIITPITTSVTLAFMPVYRWDKPMRRARRMCRVQLARELRPAMSERYAREQMTGANSGTDSLNRHWRQA
jgi:hypothetical protein